MIECEMEEKESFTVLRGRTLERRLSNPYSLVICGASRGGTSAVAIAVRLLRGMMHGDVHDKTHEDLEFAETVLKNRENRFIKLKRRQNNPLVNLIKSRDEMYSNGWDLKLPHALQLLNTFDTYCRNPIFIVVIRHPLAIVKSLMRRDSNYTRDIDSYIKGLRHVVNFFNSLKNVENIHSPLIICSYEDVIKNPEVFVEDLISTLNLEVPDDQIETVVNLISKPGYKKLK